MTPLENKSQSLHNALGTALLLFGAILCYLRAVAIAQQIANTLAPYGSEAFAWLPATGLAAARLLQELTVNPASALSAILQFLLSFWPVTILLLGVLLLRNRLFAIPSPAKLAQQQESHATTQEVRE